MSPMNFSEFRTEVLNDIRRGTWVFRGQENPEWTLECSYSRFCRQTGQSFSRDGFLEMLDRFIGQVSDYYVNDHHLAMKLSQKIAFAQHFGLPTPFLDWTYSPYVAMYFAVNGLLCTADRQHTVKVWAMNIGQLGDEYLEPLAKEPLSRRDEGFWFVSTSNFSSRRIARQQGCFTCSNSQADLADRNISSGLGMDMITYLVSCNVVEILQELRLMGITGSNMFDDIDYIAKDVVLDSLFGQTR